ncbi:MAG: hypothetical protein IPP72_04115 [Chitinophagaceae bacterium]|nr:hypothetical protein [Chitinophagaceae bacterium]
MKLPDLLILLLLLVSASCKTQRMLTQTKEQQIEQPLEHHAQPLIDPDHESKIKPCGTEDLQKTNCSFLIVDNNCRISNSFCTSAVRQKK